MTGSAGHRNDFLIEVCADDLRSVTAANRGGADRIEFCACLSEGGVTPSSGIVQVAISQTNLPVRVLIRPRSGDFLYSPHELDSMVSDISAFLSLGVEGFVIGALTPSLNIDTVSMARLVKAVKGKPWTFHRAFDFVKEPLDALNTVISLGADTILTSGQRRSASEGWGLIRNLIDAAGDKINIMAGGGITPDAAYFLHKSAKCRNFHLSAGTHVKNSLPVGADPEMRTKSPLSDYLNTVTDTLVVQSVRNILNKP